MYQYSDLLKNRRSIRDFTEEKVTMQELEEILHETCMAPSANNRQPWRFIIIQDQALMKKISDESKKNLLELIAANPNSSMSQYKKLLGDPNFNVFYNAPCLVLIVSSDTTKHVHYDMGLAASYFMCAATARNLGTCFVGLGDCIEDQMLRDEIGLPSDYDKVVPIIIGHPKHIPAMPSRNKPIILKKVS